MFTVKVIQPGRVSTSTFWRSLRAVERPSSPGRSNSKVGTRGGVPPENFRRTSGGVPKSDDDGVGSKSVSSESGNGEGRVESPPESSPG